MAVKVFTGPPALFAIASAALVVSDAGVMKAAPFFVQLACGLISVAVTAFFLAPFFARLCHATIAAGCLFGVLVLTLGASAFCLSAALVYPDFAFSDNFVRPMCWFAICGIPMAGLAGLFFSGAAQRFAFPT